MGTEYVYRLSGDPLDRGYLFGGKEAPGRRKVSTWEVRNG